jgi:hypothetical protein
VKAKQAENKVIKKKINDSKKKVKNLKKSKKNYKAKDVGAKEAADFLRKRAKK